MHFKDINFFGYRSYKNFTLLLRVIRPKNRPSSNSVQTPARSRVEWRWTNQRPRLSHMGRAFISHWSTTQRCLLSLPSLLLVEAGSGRRGRIDDYPLPLGGVLCCISRNNLKNNLCHKKHFFTFLQKALYFNRNRLEIIKW
jgi:hypothetical protein